ncbi:hypothetical protein [Burkholderia anthina]|uniref:hypothetical protein n=1 Tax=Burkholderia anthina TaxID=179879 RepID=UPI0037BE8AC9
MTGGFVEFGARIEAVDVPLPIRNRRTIEHARHAISSNITPVEIDRQTSRPSRRRHQLYSTPKFITAPASPGLIGPLGGAYFAVRRRLAPRQR